MKLLLTCVSVSALLLAAPVHAQMQTEHGPRGDENATNSGGAGVGQGKRRAHTVPPIEMESDKPPLQLSEAERAAIAEALVTEHTYQRRPKDFEPRVGVTVKADIKLNPMPRPLVYEVPRLVEYTYAKLQENVLVIDPMSMKVVDVIPRKYPTTGVPMSPMQWWSTRGRELVGLPPEPVAETTGAGASPSLEGTMPKDQPAPGAKQ